jgi:hypothetical protein
MLLGEGREHAADLLIGEQRHAHAQHARLAARDPPHTVDRLLAVGEQAASAVEQLGAGLGELDASARSHQELHAERPLETGDRLGERRLADEQPQGRAAEVELLRDRYEIAQLSEFGVLRPLVADEQ